MQHGPTIVTLLVSLSILLGIIWLGGRILVKWDQVYASKKAQVIYWLGTGCALGILLSGRWLRFGDVFGQVLYKYAIYAAYIWLIGLVLMLLVLLVGQGVRMFMRKLAEPAAKPKNEEQLFSRRQFLQGTLAVVPVLPLAVSSYGVIGGDNTIVVNKYELRFRQLPLALDGFTIAQISDTHIGTFFGMDKLDRVINMVKRQQPQLLAITGDLVDDLNFLSPTIERLTALQTELPYGIFYCWGNHEYFKDINRISRAVYQSPITMLENNSRAVTNGLYLVGVDYPWGNNKAEMEDKRQRFFAQAVRDLPQEGFPVLITHHPDFFENAFAAGIPLSIAGHTHGGQIAVGQTSLLPVKYRYMKGMYQQDNCYGYVSAGTGHWMPLRIGCPAEVSFFTLRRKQ